MMEEKGANSVGLLRVPTEIMYSFIFPHLQLNDLLRLRRVSKQIQLNSNDYIRNHYNDKEREINMNDHTFADFIRLDLSTSRIYLNNTNCTTFYVNSSVSEFLRLYAPAITHLRVRLFGKCASRAENIFFLALLNLEHLELEILGCADARKMQGKYNFPENFQTLKTLRLGKILITHNLDANYAWDFMEFCGNLEHIGHPSFEQSEGTLCKSYTPDQPFDHVTQNIMKRLKHGLPIKLKQYDLANFQLEDKLDYGITRQYFQFAQICFTQNIELLNVDIKFYGLDLESITPNHWAPLVSTQNVDFQMLRRKMANLKKVVITSTRGCFCPAILGLDNQDSKLRWPKLHTLDITIDSERTSAVRWHRHFDGILVDYLLFCLLGGYEKKAALRELAIRWNIELDVQDYNYFSTAGLGQGIVNTCENLTRLTISNWKGNGANVAILWSGLGKLEEVTIDECMMFEDVHAFVGRNVGRLAFLKLKKLRKFTLSGLDKMPKITDQAFYLVFRHLKVKEFHLTSEEPIESVTIGGIRSLLTGDFNQHVEKFPFENWSLENVTEEEFTRLKLEFRASHML